MSDDKFIGTGGDKIPDEVRMLLQQISIWETFIAVDDLKQIAALLDQLRHRHQSALPLLAHFNSLNSMAKADEAFKAKSELFYALANVIEKARAAKALGVDIDATVQYPTENVEG